MTRLDVVPYVSMEMLCGRSTRKAVLTSNIVMALREIDKVGSMNKAVKNLHMGYSNTFYAIADIEEALGCIVVERVRPHGSKLTDDGRRLVTLFEEAQEKALRCALDVTQGEENQDVYV